MNIMYLRSSANQPHNKLNTARGRGKRLNNPSKSFLNPLDVPLPKSILDQPVLQFRTSPQPPAEDSDSSSDSLFPISNSTPVVDQGQPIDNSLSHTSTLLEFEDITTNMTSAPNSDPTRNLGTGESGPNLNNLLSILESIRGDQRTLATE